MSTVLRLPPIVVSTRENIARGRDKLRGQHDGGTPGVQVCAHFTELLEEVVRELLAEAIAAQPPAMQSLAADLALVAHSGFGRREMAPYSDLDVMLLHPFRTDARIQPLVRRFAQNLYDTGLEVGFASRSPAQACEMSLADATVFTALTESRLIWGSEELFARFDARFRRMTRRHWRKLYLAADEARRDERRKFGETVFMLEPNVKRSRGGLRELQLIRWLGFIRHGESDWDGLQQAGHLAKDDARRLRHARDWLLWLRNDLHFQAGKASDLLDRAEQLRIAEGQNYPPMQGLMPVEQFMRTYFDHTTTVREIASHFAAGTRPRPPLRWLFEPLLTHRFEGDFRVGPATIAANRRGLGKLRGDLGETLRLLDLANLYDKRIDSDTWRAIRTAMYDRGPADPDQPLPPQVAERFLSLLSSPARLAELLRKLHELRVLEQLVPGMSHARGLLQFNAYHSYTVDEHSLRVVEELTRLLHAPGTAGEVYRGIKNKRTVHLAALIHDLGKGYPEDHSEVGLRLAEQTAARLNLPEHETETLKFLVHKHLRMSHLAQQHDIHDDHVVAPFAAEVGSPERLQMLYVLTIADLAGVGPGVLNEWKQQLLTDLYGHTLRLLASDSPAEAARERIKRRREELLDLSRRFDGTAWWETQVLALPASCLFSAPPAQLVAELDRIRKLPRGEAVAWGQHLPGRNVVEYTVGTYEGITPGIFHKLTGALSSNGHSILSADISTLADGVVLDRFYVQDQDFSGPPPADRIEQVRKDLVAALKTENVTPVFRKLWNVRQNSLRVTQRLPTRVNIDNATAEKFTILAIFAYDKMGLLYLIARTLFELGLSVSRAKIGTHLDQVVDVFYVTDQEGRKLTDERHLGEIRQRLMSAVEQFEAEVASV
ncbi:MAG: [protein-PII] uridylyltransferase [Pirellulaceae bacterium]|nr:[protein-PII] uridylyltransferase [Pirellulaceae bacterium]